MAGQTYPVVRDALSSLLCSVCTVYRFLDAEPRLKDVVV